MSDYNLNSMGSREFEHLVQSLSKKIIGPGTTTFGDGPDGGREATFDGIASYPSEDEKWNGHWIFQAKHHNVERIGGDKARQEIMTDLDNELTKIYDRGEGKCDNYILATNVPLSSVPEKGTHDKIENDIIPKYTDRIRNIHVWGYDEICRFLDCNPEVRYTYSSLILPSDILNRILDQVTEDDDETHSQISEKLSDEISADRSSLGRNRESIGRDNITQNIKNDKPRALLNPHELDRLKEREIKHLESLYFLVMERQRHEIEKWYSAFIRDLVDMRIETCFGNLDEIERTELKYLSNAALQRGNFRGAFKNLIFRGMNLDDMDDFINGLIRRFRFVAFGE